MNAEDKRKKDEGRFWGDISEDYDEWVETAFDDQYKVFRPKIRSYIGPDDVVLEIGTGTGDIAFFIADKCKKVIGTDISPEMIEIANRKRENNGGKNIQFQEEDAYDLSFSDSSFDKVVCVSALQTMKLPERAVTEGWRVLKNGGEFISITYCYGDSKLIEYIKLLKCVIQYGKPKYWSNFDCVDIEDLFVQAGFETIESEEIFKTPVVLFLRCRKKVD